MKDGFRRWWMKCTGNSSKIGSTYSVESLWSFRCSFSFNVDWRREHISTGLWLYGKTNVCIIIIAFLPRDKHHYVTYITFRRVTKTWLRWPDVTSPPKIIWPARLGYGRDRTAVFRLMNLMPIDSQTCERPHSQAPIPRLVNSLIPRVCEQPHFQAPIPRVCEQPHSQAPIRRVCEQPHSIRRVCEQPHSIPRVREQPHFQAPIPRVCE